VNTVLSKCKQLLQREILNPGFLSIFINPYYFIKKGLITKLRKNAGYIRGTTLDFGCGKRSYEHLFDAEKFIGLEIEQSGHDHSKENIDVYYDGQRIPFKNRSFDCVLSIEVIEHVFNPEEIFNEFYRVLKPGGHILITCPFTWEEHEQPYDFSRYTSFGIQHLLETHNFTIIKIEKSNSFIETIFQLWNLYLYKKLFPKSKLLQIICIPLLIFPANLIGTLLSLLLPKNSDLFLNTIVVAKKDDAS